MALNLASQALPFIVAFFAVPPIIKGMGTDRFGVLTLVWAIVAYFSIFDLGVGRALTKFTAEKIGKGSTHEIPQLVWTAQCLILGLAIAASILISVGCRWLVCEKLGIPEYIQTEAVTAFYVLIASIPVMASSAGFKGVLEAYQRFDLVSYVQIASGVLSFGLPLLILPFSIHLLPMVAALAGVRVLTWAAYLFLCRIHNPAIMQNFSPGLVFMSPLLKFGAWLSVSSLIGPLLLYSDRFFISAMLSVQMTAYYTTPFEVVTKLWIVPSAFTAVLFPAFSEGLSKDARYTRDLYYRGIGYAALILVPLSGVIIYFARDALLFWIGPEFATEGFRVAQILSVGVLVNSTGLISTVLVQGSGRADWTAKLHIVELPLYLSYLWFLVARYGIEGAAVAWLLRVTLSSAVLTFMAHRCIRFLDEEDQPPAGTPGSTVHAGDE